MNPEHLIKKAARIAGAGGLFLSSVISPVDSPTKVSAGPNETPQGYTLLHSDPASQVRTDIVNYLFLPYKGATQEMLQNVAQDILKAPGLFYLPAADDRELKEYQSNIRIYTTTPLKDLPCTGLMDCLGFTGLEDIWSEIKRMKNTAGITPHETLAVVRMKDGQDPAWIGTGTAAGLNSYSLPPSIYSYASLLRAEHTWNTEVGKWLSAKNTNHERGHSEYGFGHPDYESIMSHTHTGKTFSAGESQFIRADDKLLPYAYVPRNHDDPNDKTPRHQIIAYGVSSTANQIVQAPNMSIELSLKYPDGATQMHVKGTPANNDGPAVNLIIGPTGTFKVSAPPEWYGFLPGMSYTWRVRTTSSTNPNITEDDPSWTTFQGWPGKFFDNENAEIKIKTPKRDSSGITAISPQNNELIIARRVPLQWDNKDKDVFYYEVQASKDCSFNTDPQTATAPVWHNLIHGGMTNPLNSWQTPELELGAEYCWRTRPRIQGDGTPVAWSETFRFSTPATLKSVSVYSDVDYGNGVIGPSASDMEKYGKIFNE